MKWTNGERPLKNELEQLWEKGTWQLEELLEGREAVGCEWVFLRKKNEEGNIEAYKA